MTALLFCKFGRRKGDRFRIETEAAIGRNEPNEIALAHPSISGQHARIFQEKGTWFIEDNGSKNGTFVDGIKVEGREKLGRMHVIRFAASLVYIFQNLEYFNIEEQESSSIEDEFSVPKTEEKMDATVENIGEKLASESIKSEKVNTNRDMKVVAPVFDVRNLEPESDREQTAENPQAVVVPENLKKQSESIAPPAGQVVLEFLNLPKPCKFVLKNGKHTIGRSKKASLVVDHGEISRIHAAIEVTDREITIRDEGSTNHTFVNETEIEKKVAVPLPANLGFGKVKAQLRRDPPRKSTTAPT